MPGDDESSGEDEEVIQIRAELKELKKKLKAGGMLVVDEERHEVNVECANEEDDSYDETSYGELVRKEKKFPKFDANAPVPVFTVGMAFSDKSTFREAIIKYGLAERKVIKFVKNESTKCRAICSWPKCT